MSCIKNNLRYLILEYAILILWYDATRKIVDFITKNHSRLYLINRPYITPLSQY